MGQLTDWQTRAWANKQAKGFNTRNVEQEFNYTYAELAEAYDAYRKNTGHVAEELADTAIFIFSLAKMLGVDLETAIDTKLKINEDRAYRKENGHHIKIAVSEIKEIS
jgi:NTP pyrophosphatase (non-canonical NTP hydrolase)